MVNPLSNKISVKEARLKKLPIKTLQEQILEDLAKQEARRLYEKGRNKQKIANKYKRKARLAFAFTLINTVETNLAPCTLWS